jgi:hypothetical protein
MKADDTAKLGRRVAANKKPGGITVLLALTLRFSSILYFLIAKSGHVGGGWGAYIGCLMWCPGVAALLTCKYLGRDVSSLGWSWGKSRYQAATWRRTWYVPENPRSFKYAMELRDDALRGNPWYEAKVHTPWSVRISIGLDRERGRFDAVYGSTVTVKTPSASTAPGLKVAVMVAVPVEMNVASPGCKPYGSSNFTIPSGLALHFAQPVRSSTVPSTDLAVATNCLFGCDRLKAPGSDGVTEISGWIPTRTTDEAVLP